MHLRLLVALAAALVSVPAVAKPPRLTLMISVDSMGSDVFMRMRPRFRVGLAALVAQGAYYPNARYTTWKPVTAIGHATMVTGANPWRTGIIGNKLYNRATGRAEPPYADPTHPVLEAPLGVDDSSPENMLAETIGDRLRESTQGRGKAVSISYKARAAIGMGGKLGQAWWFSDAAGKFVTGTWYAKEFPAWVKAFNDKKLADAYFAKEWTLAAPPKEYVGEDDRPFESDWLALGRVFPHKLTGGLPAIGPQTYQALAHSPMFNDVLVAMAKAAMDGEQLGKDDVPDVLMVSLSATDYIFHLFGPYSWETQDAYLRLDRQIADLVAAADRAAGGRANLLIVLTGDHGGAAIPEEWAAAGLPGARLDPNAIQAGLSKELQSKFSANDLVAMIEEGDVYLSPKSLADHKLDGAAVRRAAKEWLAKQPHVAGAATREEILSGGPPGTAGLEAVIRKGYHPDRSGDVVFITRPFTVLTSIPTGTDHGMPYAYDQQVPLILAGKGVKPGLYPQDIDVVDIAPTMASLMELGAPAQSEGSVRSEAILPVK
jgi:predicted AlkP superfamily pyrophosphatase or phosphodiesterase